MNLEPVAEYIESNGLGRIGETLFAYHMPETVKSGILLVGSLSGEKIDHELPRYRKSSFQVIVRHTKRRAGIDLTESIMDLLNIANREISPGVFINYIRPRHEPIVFPSSEGDYLEMSVNYDACYVRT